MGRQVLHPLAQRRHRFFRLPQHRQCQFHAHLQMSGIRQPQLGHHRLNLCRVALCQVIQRIPCLHGIPPPAHAFRQLVLIQLSAQVAKHTALGWCDLLVDFTRNQRNQLVEHIAHANQLVPNAPQPLRCIVQHRRARVQPAQERAPHRVQIDKHQTDRCRRAGKQQQGTRQNRPKRCHPRAHHRQHAHTNLQHRKRCRQRAQACHHRQHRPQRSGVNIRQFSNHVGQLNDKRRKHIVQEWGERFDVQFFHRIAQRVQLERKRIADRPCHLRR